MEIQKYYFGIIGLGTMGRNLAFNICDHGYSVDGAWEKMAALFIEWFRITL